MNFFQAIAAVFPYADSGALVNTAVITADLVKIPIHMATVDTKGTLALDATVQSSCVSEKTDVIQTDASCRYVFFDGRESQAGSVKVMVVPTGTLSTSQIFVQFQVWVPALPLTLDVAGKTDGTTTLGTVVEWKDATTCKQKFQETYATASATFRGGAGAEDFVGDVTGMLCNKDVCMVQSDSRSVVVSHAGNGRVLIQGSNVGEAGIGHAKLLGGFDEKVVVSNTKKVNIDSVEFFVVSEMAVGVPSYAIGSTADTWAATAETGVVSSDVLRKNPVIAEAFLSDGTTMLVRDVQSLKITAMDASAVVVGSAGANSYCNDGPCVYKTGTGHGMIAGTWNMGGCASISGFGNIYEGSSAPAVQTSLTSDATTLTHPADQAAQAGVATISNIHFMANITGADVSYDLMEDNARVEVTMQPPNVLIYELRGNKPTIRVHPLALESKTNQVVKLTTRFKSDKMPLSADIDITVVFAEKLELKVFSYPPTEGKDKTALSKLFLIGDTGRYQDASIEMHLALTDSSTVDVTAQTRFLLGDSAMQLKKLDSGVMTLSYPTGGLPATVAIAGKYGLDNEQNKDVHTSTANVELTGQLVQIDAILKVRFVETSTGSKAVVDVLLTDGSTVESYAGPVGWTSSAPEAWEIGADGNMVLRSNWYTPVLITANIAKEQKSFSESLPANLQPGVGGVDLGSAIGVPLEAAAAGDTITIPVRLNLGHKDVDFVQFTVKYDDSLLKLQSSQFVDTFAGISADGSLSDINAATPGQVVFSAVNLPCTVLDSALGAALAASQKSAAEPPTDCIEWVGSVSFKLKEAASAVQLISIVASVESFRQDGRAVDALVQTGAGAISFEVDNGGRRASRAVAPAAGLAGLAVARKARQTGEASCPASDLNSDCKFDLLDIEACLAAVASGDSSCNFDLNAVSDPDDVAYLLDVLVGTLPLISALEVKPVAKDSCKFTASLSLDTPSNESQTEVYYVLTSANTNEFAGTVLVTGATEVPFVYAGNSMGAAVWRSDLSADGEFIIEALLDNDTALSDGQTGVSILMVDTASGTYRLFASAPARPTVGDTSFEVQSDSGAPVTVTMKGFNPLKLVENKIDSATCEIVSDRCASNPCRYGSTCTNKYAAGYFCACTTNHTGPRCGWNVNDPDYQEAMDNGLVWGTRDSGSGSSGSGLTCANTPCKRGGACKDGLSPWGSQYFCECPWPFASASDCSKHTCDVNNGGCVPNQGTCDRSAESDATVCVCDKGYAGRTCDEYTVILRSAGLADDNVMTTTIIGVIVLCAVVVVAGLILLVTRAMGEKKDDYSLESAGSPAKKKHDFANIDTAQPTSPYPSQPPSYTPPEHSSTQFDSSGARKIESPINQLKTLEQKLAQDASGNAPCDREFASVPKAKPGKTFRVCELPENKLRNRYRDIRAYDDTRVRLLDSDNDYINANHVVTSVAGRQFWYIASQGPTPATCSDYWQMVWEQQSLIVLMVTNDVEGGRVKCEKYWPDQGEDKVYGDLTISSTKQRSNDTYTIRGLKVRHNVTGEVRKSHIRIEVAPLFFQWRQTSRFEMCFAPQHLHVVGAEHVSNPEYK